MGCTYKKPSLSMYCTIKPIWSQWPASMMRMGGLAVGRSLG
jgi:hypothetical protein